MAQAENGDMTNIENGASFCAIGWVNKVDQGFEEQITQALIVTGELPFCAGCSDPKCVYRVFDWNDAVGRTFEEVKAAFTKAATYLEESEQ